MAHKKDNSIEIFVSYSHKDERLKNDLIAHLSVLEREGLVKDWHDRKIAPGVEWSFEIDQHLDSSSIILLLISSDFIHSDYCYEKEMQHALKRHKNKNAIVIPIILRECDWKKAAFADLQALPKDGKPIKSWSDKDKAFKEVTMGIRKSIKEYQSLNDDSENKIIDFCQRRAMKRGEPSKTSTSGTITQTIIGNNNLQAGGNIGEVIIHSNKIPQIKMLPPLGSIGNNGLLKESIIERFNKLGDERKKRFEDNAFPVMYKNFKRDFGIKGNKWTVIWSWPESCANEIIVYLDDKYSNTIQGRIEKAGKRINYIHTRPHLYKMEKEYAEHLGISKEEVKIHLEKTFNVSTHAHLTHLQHWLWVKYLEGLISHIPDR